MKHLAPGKARARTLVDLDLLPKLRRLAAERDLPNYTPLVVSVIDRVNDGGRLPAVADSPPEEFRTTAELTLDADTWAKLRVTAAEHGRSRQGLLRDVLVAVAATAK